MNLFSTLLVWTWLLGIALVVPATLPAGGGQKSQKSIIHHKKYNTSSPIIAFKEFNLLSSASINSSILTRVKEGTPLKVLKAWDSPDSGKWLLVDVLTHQFNQIFSKRGWVRISNS